MPTDLTATTRTVEIATVIFPFYAQTGALIPFGSYGHPVANIELDTYWNYQKPTSYSSYYPQFLGAHPYLPSDSRSTPFLNTTTTVGPQFVVLSRVNDGTTVHLYVNGTEAINYATTLNSQELALPSPGSYQLGGSDFGVGTPKSSTGFNGIIYGAKFSSTAYSQTQIQQDYQAWVSSASAKGVNVSTPYTMPPSFPADESLRMMCLGESNAYGHGLSNPSLECPGWLFFDWNSRKAVNEPMSIWLASILCGRD